MAKQVWTATGRRKRSVAQVRMTAGKGNITVNGKDVNEYMPFAVLVMDLKQPLVATGNEDKFDIDVTVKGGGFSGQTGAIRLGITRALLAFDASFCNSLISSFKASSAAFNLSFKALIASSLVDNKLAFNSSTFAVKDVLAACNFSI